MLLPCFPPNVLVKPENIHSVAPFMLLKTVQRKRHFVPAAFWLDKFPVFSFFLDGVGLRKTTNNLAIVLIVLQQLLELSSSYCCCCFVQGQTNTPFSWALPVIYRVRLCMQNNKKRASSHTSNNSWRWFLRLRSRGRCGWSRMFSTLLLGRGKYGFKLGIRSIVRLKKKEKNMTHHREKKDTGEN